MTCIIALSAQKIAFDLQLATVYYHVAQNSGGVARTLANQWLQSFGKENVGGFKIANISYFSESRIWLGKILVNDVRLAKVSPIRILHYTVLQVATSVNIE